VFRTETQPFWRGLWDDFRNYLSTERRLGWTPIFDDDPYTTTRVGPRPVSRVVAPLLIPFPSISADDDDDSRH
jgi:hypothetical protein